MATVNWSLQHFTDTAANFTANNPTLLAGQLGIETDGLTTTPKFKIGDGTSTWTALPYFYGGSASAQDLNNVLGVGNTTSGQDIVLTDDDKLQIGSTAGRYISYDTNLIQIGLGIVNTNSNDHIVLQDGGGIHVDTTKVILEQLTASRLLSLNANKEVVNETGTGFLKLTAGVISYDNSSYQPLDSDLTSWAGVTRASGFDTFTTTPSSANLASLVTDETGSGALVFGTSPTFTSDITTPKINGVSGNLLLTNAAQTSGAITNFTFTNSANTGQTASTEISNFKVNGASKTWNSGNITTQRWNYFTANTAAFASASTISESIALAVEAATAGTNATITNNFALGLTAGTATVKIGNVTGSTTDPAIYMNQASPTNSNYTLQVSGGFTILNGVTNAVIRANNGTKINCSTTSTAFTQGAASSGAVTTYDFTLPSNTGQSASAEISGVKFTNATRTWAAGAISTQREFYITSPTYAFASPSTITNSYGLYVEKATAGTNATITNNWALGTNGGIFLNGTANTVLGSAALATNATTGFLHVPSCAGTPTGTPTLYTGMIPVCADSTNNKLYIYSGGAWVALN